MDLETQWLSPITGAGDGRYVEIERTTPLRCSSESFTRLVYESIEAIQPVQGQQDVVMHWRVDEHGHLIDEGLLHHHHYVAALGT
ncbi:MAG: hypothetical protein CMN25_00475 [Salinicola sp.]|nr:hypothetical protein [Salinicola sp.]